MITQTIKAPFTTVQNHTQKPSNYQIVLQPGQMIRLPKEIRALQVDCGSAWLTVDDQDRILSSGMPGEAILAGKKALISALTGTPLTITVFQL